MHPRPFAEQTPDRVAAVMAETGDALTYAALERCANRGAHLLRSLGLQSGDAVAVWLPNSIAWFELYWAAQRAGLLVVPVATTLTAGEAAYILADSGARMLVASGEITAVAELLAGGSPGQVGTVFWAGAPLAGCGGWAEAVAGRPDTPIADEEAGWHMVYSPGTTGRPKGVRLPMAGGPATAPNSFAERLHERYGIDTRSVVLSPAPIYHTAPLVYATCTQRLGGTVVMMRRFDAEAALAAIERYRVTFVQMVPTMFVRLLRLPDEARRRHDLSSLVGVVHAAAPCPVDVKRRMIEWLGPIVFEYYGGSEGNGSTFITSAEWLRKPGSVGRADWGVIHICDDGGRELPAGADGLVYFAGGLAFEYRNDPGKTLEAHHPAHPGWTTLGDIGHLDADGYLYLTDRRSFTIISGGVNIYPQEVENLLAVHTLVADVAVIGVTSAAMGEEVKAVVQPTDWAEAGPALAAELIAYCRANLSPVKCPRSVDFARELPRADTGKLYKRLIRDRYWAGYDKRVA